MKDNYDDLNETFNTEIEVQNVTENGCVRRKEATTDITDDIDKDYKYTRAQLYSLIEKGQGISIGASVEDLEDGTLLSAFKNRTLIENNKD